MVVNAGENFEFQAALNNADMIVPDGMGIVWALKKEKGNKKVERIPGVELAQKTLEIANELNKKVAIFGASIDVLNKCVEKIKDDYPNIEIVKAVDGFQGFEKDKEIAEEISKEKPNVVLVALGTPRQEVWINRYSKLFLNSIMIGIGGSLDVWSGMKKRAPGWMIDLNLEWLYRISQEPERIPRLLKTHPKFVCMVMKEINP
jgi:N-acetylglucosaminyldiphosphoundecaprenol N-acetyl-beta-D-mannosaminyltransferase